MYPSTLAAFQTWTEDQEGRVAWLYLDNLGLVTVAIGNLVDATTGNPSAPWTPALALPFKHGQGGSPAAADEIQAAWQAVKARQDLKDIGGGNAKFAALSDLRLDPADIDALFAKTRDSFIATLKKRFPNLDNAPADAQMALLGMSWALGPAFASGWPKFTAAFNSGDYLTAMAESVISNGTAKRNAQQGLMLANAAAVVKQGLDPSKLYFPQSASKTEGAIITAVGSNVVGGVFVGTVVVGMILAAIFGGKR
jgi:GH24 family phage-related lysozyme (muramidase)